MIVLSGGAIVLRDRVVDGGSLVLDGSRIAAIESRRRVEPSGATVIDLQDGVVVPGFIDVHVHGALGHDTLDEGEAIARLAAALPRFGVTGFCPTTVACPPVALRRVLAQVHAARQAPAPDAARVLGAHLESNFINPDFAGAQPVACLRTPFDQHPGAVPVSGEREASLFSGGDVLDVMAACRADIAIVTLAPEIAGGLALVSTLVADGFRVALGHSGADFETANAAIDAGARHATHLFNRMSPLLHRAPGIAGAVLSREEIAAELICDGHHVHPAVGRMAIGVKGVPRMMAITDGTALSGLSTGASGRLGGRRLRLEDGVAVLDEGTLAGSAATMDGVMRTLVHRFGCAIVDAAALCATTPAAELGLTGVGTIAEGATADLVVLDRDLQVVRTFVAGQEVYGPYRRDRDRATPRAEDVRADRASRP